MEIITYVREGAVTHRDSLGNTGRIVAGDVRVMSAGTGIWHAEFNLEPQTTIGDSCHITLHQLADCLLYRRSTAAMTYAGTRVLALMLLICLRKSALD